MATRTATPKTKSAPRATAKRAAPGKGTARKATPRKTVARKAPARNAAAGQGGAARAGLAALRRNAFPLAGAVVAGAATAIALFFTRRANVLADGDAGLADRADPHFRPDMDAPMTAADRAALTPAVRDDAVRSVAG